MVWASQARPRSIGPPKLLWRDLQQTTIVPTWCKTPWLATLYPLWCVLFETLLRTILTHYDILNDPLPTLWWWRTRVLWCTSRLDKKILYRWFRLHDAFIFLRWIQTSPSACELKHVAAWYYQLYDSYLHPTTDVWLSGELNHDENEELVYREEGEDGSSTAAATFDGDKLPSAHRDDSISNTANMAWQYGEVVLSLCRDTWLTISKLLFPIDQHYQIVRENFI